MIWPLCFRVFNDIEYIYKIVKIRIYVGDIQLSSKNKITDGISTVGETIIPAKI